jgi:hypothetical protein
VITLLFNKRIQIVMRRFNVILKLTEGPDPVTCYFSKPGIGFPEDIFWCTLKGIAIAVVKRA